MLTLHLLIATNRATFSSFSDELIILILRFARRGRGEEIESLLHRGIPVDVIDDWGNTVLIVACQNGNKVLLFPHRRHSRSS